MPLELPGFCCLRSNFLTANSNLFIVKLKDISFRKFFWIILYSLIDFFCFYTV